MTNSESMIDAQEEREQKDREPVYTWARQFGIKDFGWKQISGYAWTFANNSLSKKGEEEEYTIKKIGGQKALATIYCDTLVNDAKVIGASIYPEYRWLLDVAHKDCAAMKERYKKAKTLMESEGLIGVYLKQAKEASKEGDESRAAMLFDKSSTLDGRLGSAKLFLSGANRYVYFLRTRGYSVYDIGPKTMYEYLGTPEQNYLDGVIQPIQIEHGFVQTKKGQFFKPTTMSNFENYLKLFTKLLLERGIFNAYDEEGNLAPRPRFKSAAKRGAAIPNPYRIVLDQYLNFPRTTVDKRRKIAPDINEVLLIYNAIHNVKGKGKMRDYYGKYEKHRLLYDIIIRTIRETGARPANLRWLQWQDYKTAEKDPFIAWGEAGRKERGGKRAPTMSYISPLLAKEVEIYYGSRKNKELRKPLKPTNFVIRGEFFPETEIFAAKPIAREEVSDLLTQHLQDVVKEVYGKDSAACELLGDVGAKRFRNSLATIMYYCMEDKKEIESRTGDAIETLKTFYIQDESAEDRKIMIDVDARDSYTAVALARRIFDNEYPPGMGRDEFLKLFDLELIYRTAYADARTDIMRKVVKNAYRKLFTNPDKVHARWMR